VPRNSLDTSVLVRYDILVAYLLFTCYDLFVHGKTWRRTMDKHEIGELFRTHRVLRRLTIKSLSEASGVSTAAISRLERGEGNRVSFDIVARLAKALDVGLAELETSDRSDANE
jgi:DNA-binding Xre family transcriptional regulator